MWTGYDIFCGMAGSLTGGKACAGVEMTRAFNHWNRAVESVALNHPEVDTVLCDLLEVHPAAFPKMDVLLASPECKTHSPSGQSAHKTIKGPGRRRGIEGQGDLFEAYARCELSPATTRSRATMEVVTWWTATHLPRYVIVENVVEVAKWGRREKAYQASYYGFEDWLRDMLRLGYDWEPVSLNAQHVHAHLDARIAFTTPQSRDRLYLVFWRRDMPRPDLTIEPPAYCARCEKHVSGMRVWRMNSTLPRFGLHRVGKYRSQYWYACPHCQHAVEPYAYAAANVIDWTRPLERVGDKDYSPKTLERLRLGFARYGTETFVVANRTHNVPRLASEPLAPVATGRHHILVTAEAALAVLRGDRTFSPLSGPMPTHTAAGSQFMLLGRAPYLMTYNSSGSPGASVASPLPAVTTVARHRLVDPGPASATAVEDFYSRMLWSGELLPGTGYPADYQMAGNEEERIAMIGNSNPPAVEQLLLQRCIDAANP